MNLNPLVGGLKRQLQLIEPYFFPLVAIVHMVPFWLLNTLPTLDGAAHLYNANVLQHLLFEPGSALENYYRINPYPVPNWTGHLVLMALNAFLPALFAEKLFLALYVLSFGYAFRWLIKVINPDNKLLSYLAFPFMYSILFFVGFYNFSIAIVLMFLTLAFWISHERKDKPRNKPGFVAALAGLMIVTYFSHVMVFATLGLVLIVKVLYPFLYERYRLKQPSRVVFSKWKDQIQGFVIAASVPGLAMLHYLVSRDSAGIYQFVNKLELLKWIYKIRPLVTFHFGKETPYLIPIFFLLLILSVIGIFRHLSKKASDNEEELSAMMRPVFLGHWLIVTTIILLLYFVLPKSDGSAGFISVRFCYLFYLVAIAGVASLRLPRWTTVVAALIALIANFGSNAFYYEQFKGLDQLTTSVHKASAKVESYSTVLPIINPNHWMSGHAHCYIGVERPVILLKNYECRVGYFPLLWNNENTPNFQLGTASNEQLSCENWQTNTQNEARKIDYCLIVGSLKGTDSTCRKTLKPNLKQHYTLAYEDGNCKLYKLKNKK